MDRVEYILFRIPVLQLTRSQLREAPTWDVYEKLFG
jgi:hypothetical protein